MAIFLSYDYTTTSASDMTQDVFLMCPYSSSQLARDPSTEEVRNIPSRHHKFDQEPTAMHHSGLEVAPPTFLHEAWWRFCHVWYGAREDDPPILYIPT